MRNNFDLKGGKCSDIEGVFSVLENDLYGSYFNIPKGVVTMLFYVSVARCRIEELDFAFIALTAYSPSVLVLNDMLRQQLQLTQQFAETQRRMYKSYIGASVPDHNYTTLEQTKEVGYLCNLQGTHSNCIFKFPGSSMSDCKFSLCQFIWFVTITHTKLTWPTYPA